MRKWSKKAINLASIPRNGTSQAGHVLIPSFRPSTGGAGSGQGSLVYSQAEGQGSLRQAILYDHSNKSNAKPSQRNSSDTESKLASSLQTSGLGLRARLVLGRAPRPAPRWTSREVDLRELRGHRGQGRVQCGRALSRPLSSPLR